MENNKENTAVTNAEAPLLDIEEIFKGKIIEGLSKAFLGYNKMITKEHGIPKEELEKTLANTISNIKISVFCPKKETKKK